MGRKRIKDKSDFSITIKFPEDMQASAQQILAFVKHSFPAVAVTEYPPEGEQRYFYMLVEIVRKKKKV